MRVRDDCPRCSGAGCGKCGQSGIVYVEVESDDEPEADEEYTGPMPCDGGLEY